MPIRKCFSPVIVPLDPIQVQQDLRLVLLDAIDLQPAMHLAE